MKTTLLAIGVVIALANPVFASDEKFAPLEVEMAGQVYLCGLNAQLADATKGSKQKALLEEAKNFADNSREKIKSLTKTEYQKYPENDPAREKVKSMYSAYLAYLSAAMWGKDLMDSSEALAFKEKVSDYKAEVDLR